jgi:hypothetical protein
MTLGSVTAASTILTIYQPADDKGIRIYGYDDVAARYAELFVNSAGYTVLDASTDRGLVLKGHGIDFYVNSGGTHYGRMTYDLKLGLGTTTPFEELHIKESGASILINSDTDTTSSTASIRFKADSQNNASRQKGAIFFERTDIRGVGKMHFATHHGSYSGGSPTSDSNAELSDSRMTIDHLGSVGIGTTAPKEKLHVAGSIMQGDVDTRPGGMITFSMSITEGTTTTFFNPSDLDGVWSGMIEMHAKGHNDTNRSSYQQLVFRYSNAFTALQSSNLNLTPTFSYVAGAGATQGMRVSFAGGGYGQAIDCVFRIMGSHNS